MFRRVFNLLILVLVSLAIDEAISANFGRTTTGRNRVLNQPWAASPLLRNTFDEANNPQKDCQCVIFYLCENNNWAENETLCEDSSQVCCKTDSPIIEDDFGLTPAPIVPDLVSSTQSSSVDPNVDSQSPLSSTSTESYFNSQSPLSSTSTESYVDTSSSSPSSTPATAECGIRKRNNEQNSNSDISFGEFPWMVAILRTNGDSTGSTVICGGSLLSRFVVLTAAHCIYNIDINTLRVRAGDFVINGETDERIPHQERPVSSIVTHSNYSRKVLHNDLALISVNDPFTFEDHVAPACTPAADRIYANPNSYDSQNCLVTGWTRNTDNTVQNKLRRVPASVMLPENCENSLRETRLGRSFKLHPSFLCAKEQESVCKGHGGGPLVCASRSNPNKYVQVGVVSWGIGCDSNLPGVYASLETNAQWLRTEFSNLGSSRL